MDRDALVVVSFGGPEGPAQVDDFLERIAEGRNIPTQRLKEVKQRYLDFGGVSPANQNNRKLIEELSSEFGAAGIDLPIYLGNRNSPPFLIDTLEEIQGGIDKPQKILAFITSAFSSYSSCRRYLEDIESSISQLLAENKISVAPEIYPLRQFYDHPLFIGIHSDALAESLINIEAGDNPYILFSSHSLPLSMAKHCQYANQISQACDMVIQKTGLVDLSWDVVYQSISGRPDQWLGPNILDAISSLAENGTNSVIVCPIGFLASHMEVVFDLDIDVSNHAENLGLNFVRTKTPQEDPRFASLVMDLTTLEATPCPVECCLAKIEE